MYRNEVIKTGVNAAKTKVESYIPFLHDLWDNLKFYFYVDNAYVLAKLKVYLIFKVTLSYRD